MEEVRMSEIDRFLEARETLFTCRTDVEKARSEFRWPRVGEFNWALDYFDRVPPRNRVALHIVDDDGTEHQATFADLTTASNRTANFLRALGVGRRDRILLMLGNVAPLWEVVLAAMKLGSVVIPASTLLGPDDLRDRIERGNVSAIVAAEEFAPRFEGLSGADVRIAVGHAEGWTTYEDGTSGSDVFEPDGRTSADDTLLLYFTSGTTARPKLVEHTHQSYPVGHLTTMAWIGIQPGDVHLNISSPGWAKHAWSNIFAPWNAEATAFVWNNARFDATRLLDLLRTHDVNTFCAPPTVWRMIVQQPLGDKPAALRELVSAGEPLNPEVIEHVDRAWHVLIRDGYGQTETTLQIGNFPSEGVKLGSMGKPAPGYAIVLLDPDGNPSTDGEICIDLSQRPVGLMTGYRDDPEQTDAVMGSGYYHTGDVASRDKDGLITYVGRTDDVFKASDYRISPFELESVLIEHEAVAEAAVVPCPDPIRTAVPKAFVVLASGREPSADVARSILVFCRERLAPYKRIRRLEFAELPKTISGKIRRVELRRAEELRGSVTDRNPNEFWESDFPDIKTS
jgi:acetyl-CoA synthetase